MASFTDEDTVEIASWQPLRHRGLAGYVDRCPGQCQVRPPGVFPHEPAKTADGVIFSQLMDQRNKISTRKEKRDEKKTPQKQDKTTKQTNQKSQKVIQ